MNEEKKMRKEVRVQKSAENPEPTIILAEAVTKISDGMTSLLTSGLNKKAIVILLQAETGLGKGTISTVLDALPRLKGWYCK